MAVVAKRQTKKWSVLPKQLVVMIGKRITLYPDYVRFRSVCVPWYSALSKTTLLRDHHPSRQRQFLPFLLLPSEDDFLLLPREDDNDDEFLLPRCEYHEDKCSRALLSLGENGKIYQLRGLPRKEFTSMYSPGSSHGWLVIVDEDTPSMKLVNPFTEAQLPLPPTNLFRDYGIGEPYTQCRYRGHQCLLNVKKVVLSFGPSSSSSSSSSSSDVVAISIFGGFEAMVFSRPGDKAWTRFAPYSFADVLFYKDHIYAVRGSHYLFRTDHNSNEIQVFHMDMNIGGGCPIAKLVDTLKPPKGYHFSWSPYLVESCGDLLMVASEVEKILLPIPCPYGKREYALKTIGFRVFELCQGNSNSNDNKSSSTWVQLINLGDRTLFLGVNSSFSPSTYDFRFPGRRGNSIYFTYHHCHGPNPFAHVNKLTWSVGPTEGTYRVHVVGL